MALSFLESVLHEVHSAMNNPFPKFSKKIMKAKSLPYNWELKINNTSNNWKAL